MVLSMRVRLRASIPNAGAILVAGVPFSKLMLSNTNPKAALISYFAPEVLYNREMACHVVFVQKHTLSSGRK
jgi:hypothetical protein